MKKVAIIGSGGREHAIGWNIAKYNDIEKIFFIEGNGGTEEGKGKNVAIKPIRKNFHKLSDFLKYEKIDLAIIGPEQPLSEGIVDFLNNEGYFNVFGPTQEQTRIESDKFYSYDIIKKLEIPQARGIKCITIEDIRNALNKFENPVLKKRGLAAGKGVRVYNSIAEARRDLASFVLENGTEVLVSERLFGEEFSVFAIADGRNILPMEISFQDHKRLYNGDKGPNTGGMGAYGPTSIASRNTINQMIENIMIPLVEGIGFKGFLYAGMIMTSNGPKVIEFNARFGDPEAQPAMQLLNNSLYEPLSLALNGKLNEAKLDFLQGASCCVVLASNGYPTKYKTGFPIHGIDEANSIRNVKIFHSGTRLDNKRLLTNGGRILGVTAYSNKGLKEAQKLSYEAVSKIEIPEGFCYRTDIGDKGLK